MGEIDQNKYGQWEHIRIFSKPPIGCGKWKTRNGTPVQITCIGPDYVHVYLESSSLDRNSCTDLEKFFGELKNQLK